MTTKPLGWSECRRDSLRYEEFEIHREMVELLLVLFTFQNQIRNFKAKIDFHVNLLFSADAIVYKNFVLSIKK